MFYDRHEAGRQLVRPCIQFKDDPNTIVLGLARGGVAVAYDLAKALHLPLNVVVPRKIGAPGNPELALGAILENGEGVFNDSIIQMLSVTKSYLNREIEQEKTKAHRRSVLYREFAPLPVLKDRTVLLVDDGVATGATMLATIAAMRKEGVKRVVVAVPVASTEALGLIEEAADHVVCLLNREDFFGVSYYYEKFPQTEDEEVIALLKDSNESRQKENHQQVESTTVRILAGKVHLEGELSIPSDAKGIVLFAHGSGSSRFSPRNQYVAKTLNGLHLGTLLIDLLTKEEETEDEVTREWRFNIDLLAERLTYVIDWLKHEPSTKMLSIGLFGSSTGAAAALIAAALRKHEVAAVVSRGGRPDLADLHLMNVRAPTLLIVGGNDPIVIGLNESASEKLICTKELEIVPRATHLFEEKGALEMVASLAGKWFQKYLMPLAAKKH
jgi:putative phosphoribosyl transferase